MAEIKVRQIFWRRNSPYGTYVANDLIEIYYDNVAKTIVTYLNGGLETTGDSIPNSFNYNGNNAAYYKTEKAYDVLICDSTTRVQLQRDISIYPWVTIHRYGNSQSCAVSPAVCDLVINSLPTVVNETTQGAADGEITVAATSSNGAIEYNINADFIYGAGQASGNFTGLTSGSYRIFARDASNCAANIGVIVNYNKTYTKIYELEYDDLEGDVSLIEIQERDYAGASTEVKGGAVPFILRTRAEGEQDKFIPIIGTELEINLISETNFQFLSLFTSDPNKYRVVFKKNFGSGYETLITAKLLPNQYKEQYIAPPYNVAFLATDGIASLASIPFLDGGGNKFFGQYKAIQLIAYCLSNTGLSLNIRSAVNLYALEMDSTDADDPLDQAYVDADAYYVDDTPNCLDIIRFILEPYGAQLVQWGNVWNITRVEEKVEAYDYREFDPSGVYVSNSSYNPLITSTNDASNGVIWVVDPEMEMNPAYGSIVLKYALGLKNNIVRNGDFKLKADFSFAFFGAFSIVPDITGFQFVSNGDDGVQLIFQVIDNDVVKPFQNFTNVLTDKNNIAVGFLSTLLTPVFSNVGNAYFLSKPVNLVMGGNDQIKFSVKAGLPVFVPELPYVKIRCVVQYGTFYLQGDGTWTTSATEIVFFFKEFGKFVEFSVTATTPSFGGSAAGLDYKVKVFHAYGGHSEFQSVTDLRAKVTTTLGIGHKTEWYNTTLQYYELENNTSAEAVPDIVRPDDYHATTNPVQWILKTTRGLPLETQFYIDKIDTAYLSDGSQPPTIFDADINGELNNPGILEKSVIHGSLAEIIQTNVKTIPIFTFNPSDSAQLQYVETAIQNTSEIYCGYFRDSAGVGFDNWTRSYISEELPLHEIHLRSLATQYNSPWRRLRGSLAGRDYVTPISCIKEETDDDRKYYPIALEIDDAHRIFSGEFVEVADVVSGDTPEVESAGFTIGFTIGFNS